MISSCGHVFLASFASLCSIRPAGATRHRRRTPARRAVWGCRCSRSRRSISSTCRSSSRNSRPSCWTPARRCPRERERERERCDEERWGGLGALGAFGRSKNMECPLFGRPALVREGDDQGLQLHSASLMCIQAESCHRNWLRAATGHKGQDPDLSCSPPCFFLMDQISEGVSHGLAI